MFKSKLSGVLFADVIELYSRRKESVNYIAEFLDVDPSVIKRILVNRNIRIRNTVKQRFPNFAFTLREPSKDDLYDLYVKQKLSIGRIASKYSVSETAVANRLIKHNIPRRSSIAHNLPEGFRKPSKERLMELYIEEWLSLEEIAAKLKICPTTVSRWLTKYGIPKRNNSEVQLPKRFTPPTKEDLYRRYSLENKSVAEIGDIYGVTSSYLIPVLRKYKIALKGNAVKQRLFIKCVDGHFVRSYSEKAIDDWLFEHGIEHIYEKPIPNTKKLTDFYIPKLDLYIEFLGLNGRKFYDKRIEIKERLYQKQGLRYVFINFSRKSSEVKARLAFLLSPHSVLNGMPKIFSVTAFLSDFFHSVKRSLKTVKNYGGRCKWEKTTDP